MCSRCRLPRYSISQSRKRLRIGLLCGLLASYIFFVALCASRVSSSDPVKVPLTEALSFELENCRLRVQVLSPGTEPRERAPARGHAEVWYRAAVPVRAIGHQLLWTDSTGPGGSRSFTLSNHIVSTGGEQLTEACAVHLRLHSGSTLRALTVRCTGHCMVQTDLVEAGGKALPPPREWWAWRVRGALQVLATNVSTASPVLLGAVDAGSLTVSLAKGDIFLEDVAIHGASDVKTDSGNVYTQLRSDVRLSWTSSSSFFCVAAPSDPLVSVGSACNVTHVNSTVNGSPNSTSVMELARSCDGSARLCSNDSHCRSAASRSQALNLSVPQGSFYVTLREHAGQAVRTYPGAGFNTTSSSGRYSVAFDGGSQLSLEDAQSAMADSSQEVVYIIQGPPWVKHMRPGNGYMFTVTPTAAYLQVTPWWIAFLSWGFLLQRVVILNVDLQTAPCPYAPVLDLDSIGDVYQQLHDIISPSNVQVVAYVFPSGLLPGASRPFPSEHVDWKMADLVQRAADWWLMDQTGDGHYAQSPVSLHDNVPLLAAVVISVLVSVLISVMMLYFTWQLMSTGVLILSDYGSHIQRYSQVTESQQALGGNGLTLLTDIAAEVEPAVSVAFGVDSLPQGVQKDDVLPKRPWPLKRLMSKEPKAQEKIGQTKRGLVPLEEVQAPVEYLFGRNYALLSIGRMPPMFEIIDHAIMMMQKSYVGQSLDDFLNQPGVIRESTSFEDATAHPPPTLAHFKNTYSKYCFLMKKDEHHLRSPGSIAILAAKGFKLEALSPLEVPDAFTRIRFKTERELGSKSDVMQNMQMPGETSLDFFMRAECKVTHFEQDKIDVDDFKAQYMLFCEKHRVADTIIVSKALMAQKQFTATKVPTHRIVPVSTPKTEDGQKVALLDIAQAEQHNQKIMTDHGEQNLDENDTFRCWWLVDAFTVGCHGLAVMLLAFFPVILWCLYKVTVVQSQFSVEEPELTFQVSDLLNQPAWVLPKLFRQQPLMVLFMATHGTVQICIGYAELIIYYSEGEFLFQHKLPLRARKCCQGSADGRHNKKRHRWRRWVHMEQWLSFLTTMAISSMLLALMMVWCVLGAVINPQVFLAHAVAVMTFVTFTAAKWSQMRKLFNSSFDQILSATQTSVNEAINRTLKTLIDFGQDELGSWMGGNVPEELQDAIAGFDTATGSIFQQQVMMLSNGSLGRSITSAGFDIATVVGVASGQESALEAFAELSGVPTEIARLVSGLADRDRHSVIKAIADLYSKYQSRSLVAPELAEALADLAFQPSRPTVEKCTQALYRHALPLIIRLWIQQSGAGQAVALAAEAMAAPIESGSSLVDGEARAARALLARISGSSGLRADEEALLKAKATRTVQELLREQPALFEASSALDPAAAPGALEELLQSTAVQGAACSCALDVALTLLKGEQEVLREASLTQAAVGAAGSVAVHTASGASQGALAISNAMHRLSSLMAAKTREMLASAVKTKLGLDGGCNEGGASIASPRRDMLGHIASIAPERQAAAEDLLMGVLPPLMKGIVAFSKRLDYQAFVASLRYVHSAVLEQRAHFSLCFGCGTLAHFENLGPLFHVLDLVLGTEQIQAAILNILEDRYILCLPPQVTKFIQLVLWLRVPMMRHQAGGLPTVQDEFMVSWSSRRAVLKGCLDFFHLDSETLVFLELLMALALDDIRALTHCEIGSRLAECTLKISGKLDSDDGSQLKDLMGQCFQVAMTLLASQHLNDASQMMAALQRRTGMERSVMEEIIGLCIHAEVDPQRPPPSMLRWQLMRAAAAHVGLDVQEAVGLTHLLMGHADTPEVALLIHEILRRQGCTSLDAMDIDRLIVCLLSLAFAKCERSVMLALQELRVSNRFLSALGLGQLPPRYLSEELLRSVGITHPEVLRGRLEVPFEYEANPQAWDEWLSKAASCLKGYENIGPWQHIRAVRTTAGTASASKGWQGLATAQAQREEHAMHERGLADARRRERAFRSVLHGLRLAKAKETAPSAEVQSRQAVPETGAGAAQPGRELLAQLLEEQEEAEQDSRQLAVVDAPGTVVMVKKTAGDTVGAIVSSGARAVMAGRRAAASAMSAAVGPSATGAVEGAAEEEHEHDEARPQSRGAGRLARRQQELDSIVTVASARSLVDQNSGAPRPTSSVPAQSTAKQRVNALQLQWQVHNQKEQAIITLITHHNQEVDCMAQQVHREGAPFSRVRSGPSEGKSGGALAGTPRLQRPPVPRGVYSVQQQAERQLRELQDTHTGSLSKFRPSRECLGIILRILSMESIVRPARCLHVSSASQRRAVVQEYAALLGVRPSEMGMLFSLVRPERTQDGMRAVAAVASDYPGHVAESVAQVTYSVRRTVPVYREVRAVLWDLAWRFQLPRFLGPAVLMPCISYPPQLREVGSLVHFIMAPLLSSPRYNSALQLVLYNFMGLVCGAPRNSQSLLETFGMSTSTSQQSQASAADVLHVMLRPTVSDKLLAMPRIITAVLRHSKDAVLTDLVADVFPYLLFFAGFPHAEVSDQLNVRRRPRQVLETISEETGIPREILSGIELSQRSISTMSSSDEATFSRESVLGLLLPVMSAARQITRNAETLPSDGMVKAIVSLADCRIDHLEHLAEALHLDTFLLQFLVFLVDIARHPDDSAYLEQTLQQIRTSSGIQKVLSHLGLDHTKFVALLELSFPCMDNISSLKKHVDHIGLGQVISGHIAALLYTTVNCALLHLRGIAEPFRHERFTHLLRQALQPVCSELGFNQEAVPLLGIRLFQGDFHVIRVCNYDMQLLLPFASERDMAMCVSGLLSHSPPKFRYDPVVLTGAVSVRFPAKGRPEFRVHADTPLPQDPSFTFRALPRDTTLSNEDFTFHVCDVALERQSFLVRIESFPNGLQGQCLDVRWQACPRGMTADGLRRYQHRVASAALRELEQLSWHRRIHWGGVACCWWDDLGVHPLFLLLAAGDMNAVRLASDLLCVPDALLSFLLASVSSLPPKRLRALLLADLVALPVLEKLASESDVLALEQLYPPPLQECTEQGVDPSPTDTMPSRMGIGMVPLLVENQAKDSMAGGLDFALQGAPEESQTGVGHQAGGMECSSAAGAACDREESQAEVELSRAPLPVANAADSDTSSVVSEVSSFSNSQDGQDLGQADGARAAPAEESFLSWLSVADPRDFPDELLAQYSADMGSGSVAGRHRHAAEMPWLRWRFEQRRARLCSESTFERVAIDCLAQLQAGLGAKAMETAPLDELLARWSGVPGNMHLLLSMMLAQLFALLEDEPKKRSKLGNAPGLSMLVCLSKLHQARTACCASKRAMPVGLAEYYLLPAMWGLEVHLRSRHNDLRQALLLEVQNTVHGVKRPLAWASGPLGGFSIPSCLARVHLGSEAPDDWEWSSWQWPQDELVEMCCRVAQVARLTLGVAAPLNCQHLSDRRCDVEPAQSGNRYHDQTDEATERDSALIQRGWASLLTPSTLQLFQKRELTQDLLNEKANNLLLSLAAGGADPIDGHYTIQQVHDLPDGATKSSFEDRAALYDAVAAMLATPYDETILAMPRLTCSRGHMLLRKLSPDEEWACQGKCAPDGCLSACGSLREHEGVVCYCCEECQGKHEAFYLCEMCYEAKLEGSLAADQPLSMRSVSEVFWKLLPGEEHLGLRTSLWVPQLCWHVGIDPEMTEVAMQVAHGFVEDRRGRLLRPCQKVFVAAAARLHLRGGAELLQSICTKSWSMTSASILAKHIGLVPTVAYGLIAASQADVGGWIALHESLFKFAAATPEDVVASAAAVAAAGVVAEAAAATTPAIGQSLSKLEKASRMLSACRAFEGLGYDQREGNVQDQRKWLEEVLGTLLPPLLGKPSSGWPKTEWKSAEVEPLLETIMTFALHLLSNHNTAAAQIQQESPFIYRAFGLTDQGAAYFRNLSLFVGAGAMSVHKDEVDAAVYNLATPLVSYVLSRCDEVPSAVVALPEDVTGTTGVGEVLDERMRCLLTCMCGIALQENNRVLETVKRILVMNSKGFDGHGEISQLLKATKRPMTPETRTLITESKDMRALVMVQSLFVIRRIREAGNRKKKTARGNASGAVGLSSMLNALQSFGTGTLAPASTTSSIGRASLMSGLRELVLTLPSEDSSAEDLVKAFEGCFMGAAVAPSTVASHARQVPLDGYCRLRHKLQHMGPFALGAASAEWSCAGESEPGGCRSGLTATSATGHLPCYACRECGYHLCEKCHAAQFTILAGARRTELNGLYTADKSLELQGGRFVFAHSAQAYSGSNSCFLLRSPDGFWGVWTDPSGKGRQLAYLSRQEPHTWFEAEPVGVGFSKNTALRRYREELDMRAVDSVDSRAFNAMQHFFLAFAASERTHGKEPLPRDLVRDLQVFLPVLAASALGWFEQLLSGLEKLAMLSCRQRQRENVQLLLDLLKFLSMSKEFFYSKAASASEGAGVCLLPVLVRRLFADTEKTPELEGIVQKLFNLLIGVCIEAPSDLVNKMVASIIDPRGGSSLTPFAMKLVQGEERRERAASQLIISMRTIAAEAAKGKSPSQMKLFSRDDAGSRAQIDVILESVFDLLLPFLGKELREPIYAALEVMTDLHDLSSDPTMDAFAKQVPVIAQGIAAALCVPRHDIRGIFALARGDWERAVDLCKPFCDLDPESLRQMLKFLPLVKKTWQSGMNLVESLKSHIDDELHIASRVKQISNSVSERCCTSADLFDLVDLDRSGTISLEEFRLCTKRLGFDLGEHRVLEVFSKSKHAAGSPAERAKGDAKGLTAEEFQRALDYLQHKVSTASLSLLGRSWLWLMLQLLYLCLILLLIFIFIFLAIDAFTSGGTFATIVNSAITICAGLGLARKEAQDRASSASQKRLSAVVQEVSDMVMSEQ